MKMKGKVAVMIDSHYDPTEAPAFEMFFPACGYEVDFVSDLHGAKSKTFFDNDGHGSVTVTKDLDDVRLKDTAGLVLIGGYAMDMLRFNVFVEKGEPDAPRATKFLKHALETDDLVVGTICHSLWLFTPLPKLLEGRRVTCSHNIMYDVRNAGGELVYDPQTRMLADVHVDGDLVSARHPYVIQAFMNAFVGELDKRCAKK